MDMAAAISADAAFNIFSNIFSLPKSIPPFFSMLLNRENGDMAYSHSPLMIEYIIVYHAYALHPPLFESHGFTA